MKTVIVRQLDDLGRIVIPREIRKELRIRDGEPMEVFLNHSRELVLKKFSPIAHIASFVQQYAEVMNGSIHKSVLIVDRNDVIAAAGNLKKRYLSRRLNPVLMKMVEQGTAIIEPQKEVLELIEGDKTEYSFALAPILVNGDSLGAIVILGKERDEGVTEADFDAAKTAAKFIANYLNH